MTYPIHYQTKGENMNRKGRRRRNALLDKAHLEVYEILMSLDLTRYRAHMARHRPDLKIEKSAERTLLASLHKARLAHPPIPAEAKLFSAYWLVTEGYNLPQGITLVDGKLLGAKYGH